MSLPEECLGQWFAVGSSGGISGEGTGDAPSGSIVIHANGTMDHHDESGVLLSTTAFTVSRGPTIFSTRDAWILTFDNASPQVIMVSADGRTLSLAENVYDGVAMEYARAR
jgi:hypothetical protein